MSDITDRLQHAADCFPRMEDNPYSVFVDAKVEIERLRALDDAKPVSLPATARQILTEAVGFDKASDVIHQLEKHLGIYEDVYEQLVELLEPHILREGINPLGVLPASVSESVEMLLEAYTNPPSAVVPDERGTNEYGLDVGYFRKLFNRELSSLRSFRPDELARVLARAARTADAEVLQESEFHASGDSIQDCCCGETEQVWRLCPLHSTPPKQEQE